MADTAPGSRRRQHCPASQVPASQLCAFMLVCHCNIITQKEIEATIVSLLDADPWQLIVPAKVYHTLKQRGRCCGCFPNVVETIIRVTEEYHRRSVDTGDDVVTYLDRVRGLRGQFGSIANEGRTTGHRAA